MLTDHESLTRRSSPESADEPYEEYFGFVTGVSESTFTARLEDGAGTLYDAEISRDAVRDDESALIRRDAQFCLRVVGPESFDAPVSAVLSFLEVEAPTQQEVDAAYALARDAID